MLIFATVVHPMRFIHYNRLSTSLSSVGLLFDSSSGTLTGNGVGYYNSRGYSPSHGVRRSASDDRQGVYSTAYGTFSLSRR